MGEKGVHFSYPFSSFSVSYTTDRNGRSSAAASLGSVSYIQASSVMSLGSATPATIMGWVYYSTPVAAYPNAIKLSAYGCGRAGMLIGDDSTMDRQYGHFAEDCISSANVRQSSVREEWHHWAASYSGTELEVFFDGVSIGTESYPGAFITPQAVTLVLGGGSVSDTHARFVGYLDEVRVYDRALTSEGSLLYYEPVAESTRTPRGTGIGVTSGWSQIGRSRPVPIS